MNSSEFRKHGKEMVDYIADYMENIVTRRVFPEVQQGYLREMLPNTAPRKGETWENIMRDINNDIMPGITHWQHPRFHAYFPTGNSYPSILGDMLSNAIGCNGFSWTVSAACTELENLVMDWLAKMIRLPPAFLPENGIGGGVIQAHSSVEKAAMIAMVKMRELDTDDKFSLRGATLQRAIDEDKKLGLIPFFICATLGTTSICSFDNLDELGLICERDHLWLHVDAAYAGSAFICPEFQPFMKGIEHTRLGKKFGDLVCSDSRFEVIGEVNMGLVCFRLVNACDDDILFAWKVIGEVAVDVLTACRTSNENDVLKAIQKLRSLHPTEEDDEGLTDTLSVPPPVIAEKPETEHIPEQNEGIDQGEVFLSDVNTSPSISILYDAKQRATTRRRNLLQRMTSDPKFYNSKVLVGHFRFIVTDKMNSSEFRKHGKEMVDYIADYMENIVTRTVFPEVQPGYLREMLPNTAPRKGETWENIMRDVNNAIMPGITHWQHPRFHAYFPTGNSYPSILGDMLSDAIGCVGFSWAASPACTELAILVMDWLAKMIGLPPVFLHENGIGGGVIQVLR
ncbi:hypothetical protein LSH36_1050g00038 [Paralvinella palmiformis]|uniref:Tyrosine decarboxylase n=1 Tax=Paralvinella palmiformis TaxID=53620 RepID=A0AAD9IX74_9ANNE|nr:hypothetical protein LSH36_1050g00038 [Paralvinella palmiformis]